MKDVAELAGVSISSVSHVINKTRRVEHETKQKILDAIEKLNYTPNLFARSLKGKGTKLLGVIIADIRDTFFAEVVKSMEFNVLEKGYNLILCDSENNWEKEQIAKQPSHECNNASCYTYDVPFGELYCSSCNAYFEMLDKYTFENE